jgi:ABC-type bacteriocin/lantibiotic exporter with double-glycine peptidase domain
MRPCNISSLWIGGRLTCRVAITLGTILAGGCVGYTGSARSIDPQALRSEPGWEVAADVPLIEQRNENDCGAAALAMVVAHYRPALRDEVVALGDDNQRLSSLEMRDHARRLGFTAFVVEGDLRDLLFELRQGRPVIVGMAKPTLEGHVAHYEVVIGMHMETERIATLDPSVGWQQDSFTGFLSEWQGSGRALLVIVPAP